MRENYMIWSTILHSRDFRVDKFSTRETLARQFYRKQDCSCLEFSRSKDWEWDYGTLLIMRRCIVRKLHDIDNKSLIDAHLSCRFFLRVGTCEELLERAKLCTCYEFPRSKHWKYHYGTSLNARRWNERKLHDNENKSHIHAVFTDIYFPCVRHPRVHFWKAKHCTC